MLKMSRFRCLALAIALLSGCSGDESRVTERTPSSPRLVETLHQATAGEHQGVLSGGTAGHLGVAGNGGIPIAVSSSLAGASGSSVAMAGAASLSIAGSSGSLGGTAGASSNVAGMAATANTERVDLLRRLQGTLEIVFAAETVTATPSCRAAWANTRGYIAIESPHCAAENDWCSGAQFTSQGLSPDQAELTVKPGEASTILLKGFPSRWAYGENTETVEQLALDYRAEGLVGTGVATIRRHCVGQSDLVYELQVTLGPDRTRPVVRFEPCPQLAPYAVSWGDFRVTSSEQLLVSGVTADYTTLVGVINVDDPTKVPSVIPRSFNWPSIAFSNPAEVAGTRQRLFLKTSPVDCFGNPAAADPNPITFVDDSVLTDVFDFDLMEPKGLVGQARYVPPGTNDSPCESGGCIVLGPVTPCAAAAEPTFFSFRISTSDHVSVKIRAALFSDTAASTDAKAIVLDSVGYMWSDLYYGLAMSEGTSAHPPLPYSTGFTESSIVTQRELATGAALAFTCDGGSQATTFVWVIERIELVHDASN